MRLTDNTKSASCATCLVSQHKGSWFRRAAKLVLSFNITFIGVSVRANHISVCSLLQDEPQKDEPQKDKPQKDKPQKRCRERGPDLKVRKKRKHNQKRPASGFYGVSADGKRWRAQISYSGKWHSLGGFATKQQAALAYDREAKQCGDKALNYESRNV
jgi:hypothetical protein